jgi:hypothetical protein
MIAQLYSHPLVRSARSPSHHQDHPLAQPPAPAQMKPHLGPQPLQIQPLAPKKQQIKTIKITWHL